MDQTLHALGGLFLSALPTFILLILLHFYLKAMYFRPMGRVLRERYEATEGARRMAEQSLEKAAEKAAEYDAAIRAARADLYKEQESARRSWRQEHANAIKDARASAERMVREAKQQLAADLEEAKKVLARESETLAEEITETILRRKAA